MEVNFLDNFSFSSSDDENKSTIDNDIDKSIQDISFINQNTIDLDPEDIELPTEIVKRSNYINSSDCAICNSKFSMFKSKKHCKFCGKSVCNNHAKRRHPNPQNKKEYLRICDWCHVKYLLKSLYDEQQVSQEQIQTKMKNLELNLITQQSNLKEKKNAHHLNRKKQEDNSLEFKHKVQGYEEQIQEYQVKIQLIEAEFGNIKQTEKILVTESENLDNLLEKSDAEKIDLEQQVVELENKLQAINMDIKEAIKNIQIIDGYLAKNKLQKQFVGGKAMAYQKEIDGTAKKMMSSKFQSESKYEDPQIQEPVEIKSCQGCNII